MLDEFIEARAIVREDLIRMAGDPRGRADVIQDARVYTRRAKPMLTLCILIIAGTATLVFLFGALK
jgi:hypothetical protein